MKRKIHIIAILLLAGSTLLFAQRKAQVGYNADNTAKIDVPSAACAEARSVKKGMFMPRLTYAQRMLLKVDSRAVSLCVYQSDSVEGFNRGLYTWKGNEWEYLHPSNTLVIMDSTGEVQQLRFAKVAMTGDYNDLVDAPDFSVPGSGNNGENISFSKVAFTGSYNDLLNKPEIPAALTGLKQIALTGEYKDLVVDPQIPVRLSDLRQDEFAQTVTQEEKNMWDAAASKEIPIYLRSLEDDSEHRSVTKEDREKWNRYAQTKIPSALSDMSSDEYNVTVSYAEKQTWDASAARPVPTRLSELTQDEWYQTVTDAEIAKWDASVSWVIPTSLRDLEQDTAHRLITKGKKEEWNSYAQTKIPSALSDMSSDEYNVTVSYAEKQTWDASAARTVPTKLSELTQDEWYQTVTDAEIAKWDSMMQRVIRTRLRDLAQDSQNRTVTKEQIDRWVAYANKHIPTAVGDYVTDDYYQYVTLAEKTDWDLHAAAEIPLRVSQLEQDYNAMLVTDADIARWDAAAALGHFSGSYKDLRNKPTEDDPSHQPTIIHTLSNLKPDPMHTTVDRSETTGETSKWDAYADIKPLTSVKDYSGNLSTATGKYRLVKWDEKERWDEAAATPIMTLSVAAERWDYRYMKDTPTLARVAYTGDYNDLDSVPSYSHPFVENNSITSLSNVFPLSDYPKWWRTGDYNDFPGTPNFSELAFHPTWENIANHPVYLNQLEANDESKHISKTQKSQWDEIVSFFKGEVDYSDENHNTSDITGTWSRDANKNLLRLKDNMVFSGKPKLPSRSFPSDTATAYGRNRILRVDELKKMDEKYITVKSTEVFPEGTVVLWNDIESKIPSGWCLFKELQGKFPVGVNKDNNNEQKYMQGTTGGKDTVTLTEENMPKHIHLYSVQGLDDKTSTYHEGYSGTAYTPNPTGDYVNNNSYIASQGGSQAHNNIPPYYAINFIIKSKAYCQDKTAPDKE